jgi:hypothetical protein
LPHGGHNVRNGFGVGSIRLPRFQRSLNSVNRCNNLAGAGLRFVLVGHVVIPGSDCPALSISVEY